MDFDGTIIDTESPAYESTAQIWASYGIDFPMEWWLAGMGTDRKSAWVQELENRLGTQLDHPPGQPASQPFRHAVSYTHLTLPTKA